MAYVYRHIRLDKNEPFYIGIGSETDNYKRSTIKSRRNLIWNQIVKKTDYKIDIIFESDDIEETKQKEIEFIKLYGRIDLKTGTLSNLTHGGDGVVGYDIFNCKHYLTEKQVKEIKYLVKFISASHICKYYNVTRPVIDNIKLNKTYQQVSGLIVCKKLLKKLILEIPEPIKLCKVVYRYDLNGKYIDSWESARVYIKEKNLGKNSFNHIYGVCNGKRVTAHGFLWSYGKQDYLTSSKDIKIKNQKNKKKTDVWKSRIKRKILQLDMNNNLIKEWNSLKECYELGKFLKSQIIGCCKGLRKTHRNFIWKYGDEYK